MSLSNDEVLELLNQKYTSEQIAIAFQAMAQAGYKVSPDDTEFDDDVVEHLEKILAAASNGIEQQQRALPQSKEKKTGEQVLNETIELAQVQLKGFGVDPRLTGAIIQSVFREEIKFVLALNQLRQQVAAAVWDQASTAIAEGIITSRGNETNFIVDLAQNGEAVSRMLNGYGITGGGGERLINESRTLAPSAKRSVKAFLESAENSISQFETTEQPMLEGKFDLMAYLNEEVVEGEE